MSNSNLNPNPDWAGNWYTFEELLEIRSVSPRKLRQELRLVSNNCIREKATERGRPCKLYHFMASPELAAWHKSNRHKITEIKPFDPVAGSSASSLPSVALAKEGAPSARESFPSSLPTSHIPQSSPAPNPPSAVQMAIAQLRVTAVLEYRERRKALNACEAARATCRDWSARPRETSCQVDERLPGNHKRQNCKTVSVGEFTVGTLRNWDRIYKEKKTFDSLAPQWTKCGRKKLPVAEHHILSVYAISNSTARSDLTKAVDYCTAQIPDFPKASIRTWQRWIKDMDPLHAGSALNHSLAKFRQDVSPDIETDWSKLGYNDLWTLDDVTMDWMIYDTRNQVIRPYAYVIQRVGTRQWVAVVTSETPICAEQVRTLIGCAMASSNGGIPAAIKFELGTVACGPHLHWLLTLLGVKVQETSMDSGKVFPDSYQESKGHPQGKPTIEANFRNMHNQGWAMPGQVGPEERHTMPARVEEMRKHAQKLAEKGEFLLLPNATEFHQIAKGFLEKHNDKPHSGLAEKIDPATGARVHLSPNEMAMHLKSAEVKIMPAEYLMLFHAKGERVPVTQNGIRLANKSYGRFDQALREFDAVTAYVDPSFPEQAYVQELGRYVEHYEKANPGEFGDQFEQKRSCEKKHRNQYTAAVAAAIEAQKNGAIMVDQVNITNNPVPDRASFVIDNEFLRIRIASMQQAREKLAAEKEATAANLDFHSDRLADPRRAAAPVRHSSLSDRGCSVTSSPLSVPSVRSVRAPLSPSAPLRRKSLFDVGRKLQNVITQEVQHANSD